MTQISDSKNLKRISDTFLARRRRKILQKQCIYKTKPYVFSITNDEGRIISNILAALKETTLGEMSELEDKTSNETILQKIADVKEKIVAEGVEEVTDETISRFLVISQLKTEITEALNEYDK